MPAHMKLAVYIRVYVCIVRMSFSRHKREQVARLKICTEQLSARLNKMTSEPLGES